MGGARIDRRHRRPGRFVQVSDALGRRRDLRVQALDELRKITAGNLLSRFDELPSEIVRHHCRDCRARVRHRQVDHAGSTDDVDLHVVGGEVGHVSGCVSLPQG